MQGTNTRRSIHAEAGVSVVEVGVIVALIVVVCMAGMAAMGDRTGKFFCEVTNESYDLGEGEKQGLGFRSVNNEHYWNSETKKCESDTGFGDAGNDGPVF